MPEQQDLFRKGPTGEQLKHYHLKRLEEREGDWLQRARIMMFQLAQDRPDLEVSSDHVWQFCPPPADCHPSVMGPIFRDRRFVAVGWKASTRPSAHARVIRTYRLRGDDEA